MKTIIVVLAMVSIAGTAAIYSHIPDMVPLHWNAAGEVDKIGSKGYLWLTALLPFVMLGLLIIIPRLDPRKESYQKHAKAFNLTMTAVSVFLIAIHWMIIAVTLGFQINVPFCMKFALGILFIIIGNYLPQARHNYTYGIRLPWTLDDEMVWKKTHRYGGFGFVLMGFLTMVLAFIDHSAAFYLFIGGLILLILSLCLYSWRLHVSRHP